MSIMGAVTTGKANTGIRVVLAAQEKMGKTTMCAHAPGTLLVPLEVGYAGVDVAKTPMLDCWGHVEQFLKEVLAQCAAGTFPYRTIAFDSATALERFIHDSVIQRDPLYKPGAGKKMITMDSAHGGYGKGYNLANEDFDWFLKECNKLAVNYGINIVLTCHVFSGKVIDPTSGEFDTWDILLHSPKNQKTYGKREMLTQWADVIGFIYEPNYVTKGEGISKGMSANKGRVIGLTRTPAYVAGNRFGAMGEFQLPGPTENTWNTLAHAIYNACGIDVFTR